MIAATPGAAGSGLLAIADAASAYCEFVSRLSSLAFWLVAAVSFGTGCSGTEAASGSPEESARAYVDAINAHDGEAVCALLTDAGSYEFINKGFDGYYLDEGDCPRYVSVLIGYGEEADTDTFHSARVLEIEDGERVDEMRSLKLRVEVTLNEQGNERNRYTETFDDVVWLVEQDGRWLLAKPSGVLFAAFAAYTLPEDLFEAPDLTAQQRDRERKTAAEQEAQEAESRSFRSLGTSVFHCNGPRTSDIDVLNDLYLQGVGDLSDLEAEPYGAADLVLTEVETEGDELCVRVRVRGGEIRERLTLGFEIYSPAKSPTYLGPVLELRLEVRADGRARLGYEDENREDEYGRHPFVSVPSELGREGDTFSFRVARAELPDTMRFGAVPEWDGFLWGGITFYRIEVDGEPRSVSDYAHVDNGAMTSHPGGQVFPVSERQERDLPTG